MDRRLGNGRSIAMACSSSRPNFPEAGEYRIDITASPEWKGQNDERALTVTLSMLRLVPQDDSAIS